MGLSAADRFLFYTELAKLLEAGFGIRAAAGVMRETRLPPRQAALLERMEAGLEAGQSIAQAFAGSSGEISELEKNIIAAGERGGRLGPAFQQLADYYQLVAQSRREALSSLAYPGVLLHMGVIIGVLPQALISGDGLMVMLGQLLVALLGLYAVLLIVGLAVRAVLRAAPGNPGIDRAIRRISLVGKVRSQMAMARFTRVYHTGLMAGLPMRETVTMAAEASHSGLIREAGRDLESAATAGTALGPIFIASEAFPKPFARSYATAEEAGGLDRDLDRWAKTFHEEGQRAGKALATALPKLVYLLILIFVAWKIIGFWSGYYSSMNSLLESE